MNLGISEVIQVFEVWKYDKSCAGGKATRRKDETVSFHDTHSMLLRYDRRDAGVLTYIKKALLILLDDIDLSVSALRRTITRGTIRQATARHYPVSRFFHCIFLFKYSI